MNTNRYKKLFKKLLFENKKVVPTLISVWTQGYNTLEIQKIIKLCEVNGVFAIRISRTHFFHFVNLTALVTNTTPLNHCSNFLMSSMRSLTLPDQL